MTNDSGAADFITNDGTAGRTVSGTLSAALGTGETLQVSFDNGVTWVAPTVNGTAWSVTDSASHAANWTIEAEVVDLAGNVGALASQAVTFDTTAPAAPSTPDLTAASDSGLSNTDNLTNVVTPIFAGTAEAGATVTLFDGTTAIGTGVADASGNWSFATSPPLGTGPHNITATATDGAGNVSPASGALTVNIDITAPAAPTTPDLIAASDNGVSSTDNITSITTPTFKGTAEVGSTVTLFDGPTMIGTVVTSTTGAWSFTAPILASGAHNIAATATDAAGNVSALSGALVVTILTSSAAPSTPDLIATSDSGVSNTDNITKVVRPTFTGTAGVGSTVTLFDGTAVIGTGKANLAGVWTIIAGSLADGTHSIAASAVDVTGNVSPLSGALSVTIDTTVPAAPSAPDLTAASDSGVSNTDNITNVTTPTFTGTAEAGTTVTLFSGTTKIGTGVADASGNWSITSSLLGNGTRLITAKATDLAGNVSVASSALSVTIDTSIAVGRPDLIAASDSGRSNTDNITNVKTPTFTGTAQAGSTVTLFDTPQGGVATVIGTGFATAAGTWTFTAPPLADGIHSITAQAADAAGNTKVTANPLLVTIDTLAPNAPSFTGGSLSSLSGKGEPGATVTVSDGLATIGTANVGSGGNWGLLLIASASPRSLTAVETDKAGNVGPASGSALIGTGGNDTLTSTADNDLMIGGAGADTFSFGAIFGNDVIAGFAPGGLAHDIINFHGSSTLNSFANVLSHATQVGSSLLISQDASNTLTLNNVSKSNLTTADFKFA